MADEGSSGEELALERQLEDQLDEQKASLEAVNEALASDPSNSELLMVHVELISAIKDAEEGLLHLKRSRLLKQMDSIYPIEDSPFQSQSIEIEPSPNQTEAEQSQSESIFQIGSKCRFKHTDGRWYNGYIISLQDNNFARVSFLNPTSENMTMCKFFLQQRCRFSGNCRLSHGFDISVSALKQYIRTTWHKSLVGSTIWAATEQISGIWKRAELETWDEELNLAQVIFLENGTTRKLGIDSISLSQYAEITDEEQEEDEEDDEEGEEDLSLSDLEEDEDGQQGLGFMEATKLQKGIQTETSVFAKWEHHTRGIASKMMANMGYREGMGLGVSGQGILDPILVKVLPGKQSLDHAVNASENKEGGGEREKNKKRSRGGKRKRDRKYANLVKERKAEEEKKDDVFSFINTQLSPNGNNNNNSGGKLKKESKKEENRKSLIVYDDEVKELRNRVEKLEEMVKRNRKDKAVCEAATRKLNETKRALEDAEVAHVNASNAVFSREKEKKWMKF